jgi:hypothetical protein
VVAKLLLTVIATVVLLVHTQPIAYVADAAAGGALLPGDLRDVAVQLVADAGAALLLLIATTTLGVFKPSGTTRYGRRRQRASA